MFTVLNDRNGCHMKITNPLDDILNNEAKTKILRFLCATNAQWNGRQIAKEIGIAPATAHKALRSLNREGILALRNEGKTHVYNLSETSFVVTNMLKPLFAKEDKILDGIISMIKRKIAASSVKTKIISVALFGSVNINEDHSTSDIDIAVIIKNSEAKAKVGRLFEEIDRQIFNKVGNTLSPYINTSAEFKTKHRKGLPVIKNILKAHRIIYGRGLGTIL